MVVMILRRRKLVITMTIPKKPFKKRLVAEANFLGSPLLVTYSKAAIRRLVKKSMPMIKSTKGIILKPPLVRRSLILLTWLISKPLLLTGSQAGLTPGFWMRSLTLIGEAIIFKILHLTFKIYYKPGMARRLMPINFNKMTDIIMKVRPMTALVMISLPALSLSGMPAEVVTIKTP